MIAIAIFSIGVLTILNLLVNNLYFLDKASTKTQASFLAKEGIELVYNLRDSNLVKAYPRNCIPKTEFMAKKIDPNDPNSYCTILGSGDYAQLWVFSINFSPTEYFSISEVENQIETDRKKRFEMYAIFASTGADDLSNHQIYTNSESVDDQFIKFARYIIVQPLKEKSWEPIATDNILKLESHVLYKNGTKTGEVIFESFIWNY